MRKNTKKATVPKKTIHSKVPSKNTSKALEQMRLIAKTQGLKLLAWEPDALINFAKGRISLATLEKIPPKKLQEMAELGYRLLSQGKLEASKRIFLGLYVLNPYESYYLLALASIAKAQHNFDEAEKAYSRAINVDQSSLIAYANRGEVRILQGNLPGAISDLLQTAKLDHNAKNKVAERARILLSVIYSKLGKAQATT